MNNNEMKIKGTIIGEAVTLDRRFRNPVFRFISFLIWLIGIAAILVIIDFYILHGFASARLFGLSLVAFSFFLFYLADRNFYFSKAKRPEPFSLEEISKAIKDGNKFNLFQILSFESAKAFSYLPKGLDSTTTELALSVLASPDMNFILFRLGLGREAIENYIKSSEGVPGISEIFISALECAVAEKHHQIEIGDIFYALASSDKTIKKLIIDLKIDLNDLANLIYWQTYIERKIQKEKQFIDPDRLRLTGGVGRDWAFGWTPFLKQFSVDITRQLNEHGLDLEIVGHGKEIDEIKESLLRQNGGNAILVGEPGVGKRTAVLGFAEKVLEGQTFSQLDFEHIVQIDVDYLMAGASNPSEITERISGVLNEVAAAGNIIMYIENIQNLLSSGDAGKINASEVLIPFLDMENIHVLTSCDVANFNRYIVSNTALTQRFTRVNVEEPTGDEMIRILEDVVPHIEQKTSSIVSYGAIKQIVADADKYIQNIPNPEKSINLLDSVATHAVIERGRTVILPKDVDTYITAKYQVPAGEASDVEKEKLINLDKVLHESVIGQNEAVSAVANALRRARAGVTGGKKPIGTFLFLGPTGVGKTETAKALSKAYFGSEGSMVRLDMSEYQNKEDIYRLIGGNIGGEEIQGSLTTAIREHPFSLLLFDEIEKAHKDILDLFLQLLDEGFITDGFGRKVSFTNNIVISTSNAGSNLIREAVKSNQNYESVKKVLLEYLQKENIYRSEFLNRFTSVIVFSPLTEAEIVQVAGLMINRLKQTMIENKGISIEIDPEAVTKLAKIGYDPQMGARPMERAIQEKVENLLAGKILSDELKKGDSITITSEDIK